MIILVNTGRALTGPEMDKLAQGENWCQILMPEVAPEKWELLAEKVFTIASVYNSAPRRDDKDDK